MVTTQPHFSFYLVFILRNGFNGILTCEGKKEFLNLAGEHMDNFQLFKSAAETAAQPAATHPFAPVIV